MGILLSVLGLAISGAALWAIARTSNYDEMSDREIAEEEDRRTW